MDKKNINEILKDASNFFRTHGTPFVRDEEPAEDDDTEILTDAAAKFATLMNNIKPAAVDILLSKEHEFLAAVHALIEKHKTLETVEQIDKLNKDILKICK